MQYVFKGKDQRAFSDLSFAESRDYAKVKAAVLKAYELVMRIKYEDLCNLIVLKQFKT